ncbi:MAG: sugar ABC transporter substrate-binding protein [Deltaproteobacteria bacterium]|jgi:ribose transport system substrate-binding protein|nr:sugar ABC transporter substrate-binding protein [Deltaproteobacteria bacterium]
MRKLIFSVLVAVPLVFLTALGAGAADLIVFSVSTTSNPFYMTMANGVKDEAKTQGLDAFVLDAQNKIDKQTADVEDALTKNIKALLINGVDDGAKPLAQMALKKGIPVIALQRDLGENNATSFIGTNNVVLGEQLIHWYGKSLGGKESKVLIITGSPGAASSEDRIKGIKETLPKYANIKVLAMQTGYYDRAKSLPVAENLLQRHPDAEAILCLNDEMAMGALAAAKAMNKKVKITGMDANPDALKAIDAGEVHMTIALPPYDIGRTGVIFAQKKLKGESIPARHIMEVSFVTKENVGKFKK